MPGTVGEGGRGKKITRFRRRGVGNITGKNASWEGNTKKNKQKEGRNKGEREKRGEVDRGKNYKRGCKEITRSRIS